MRHDIHATPGKLSLLDDAVALVEDRRERYQHGHAVRRYREEREFAISSEMNEPWWVDVGGEGEPC